MCSISIFFFLCRILSCVCQNARQQFSIYQVLYKDYYYFNIQYILEAFTSRPSASSCTVWCVVTSDCGSQQRHWTPLLTCSLRITLTLCCKRLTSSQSCKPLHLSWKLRSENLHVLTADRASYLDINHSRLCMTSSVLLPSNWIFLWC